MWLIFSLTRGHQYQVSNPLPGDGAKENPGEIAKSYCSTCNSSGDCPRKYRGVVKDLALIARHDTDNNRGMGLWEAAERKLFLAVALLLYTRFQEELHDDLSIIN